MLILYLLLYLCSSPFPNIFLNLKAFMTRLIFVLLSAILTRFLLSLRLLWLLRYIKISRAHILLNKSIVCCWHTSIFYLNLNSRGARFHMSVHFLKWKDSLTKSTFAKWIITVNAFVLYLLLLYYSYSTSFANYLHKLAIIQLVRTQYQLIVSQLVGAFVIVTLESYLGN